MQESMVIQGRRVTPQDMQWILRLIEDNRSWHRKRLSIEICQIWNWRTANGRLKDMAFDRHDTPLACFLFGAAEPLIAEMRAFVEKNRQNPASEVARFSKQLLKRWRSLFTFIYHEGVEPANNLAERIAPSRRANPQNQLLQPQ